MCEVEVPMSVDSKDVMEMCWRGKIVYVAAEDGGNGKIVDMTKPEMWRGQLTQVTGVCRKERSDLTCDFTRVTRP
jgi:hypothetical protein